MSCGNLTPKPLGVGCVSCDDVVMTGRDLYETVCKKGGREASWEGLELEIKMLWVAVAVLARQQAALIGGIWSGVVKAREEVKKT